jgi:hypothetical protein
MRRSDEPIQPMTLGNMRQNVVRGLYVTCAKPGRVARVSVKASASRRRPPNYIPYQLSSSVL